MGIDPGTKSMDMCAIEDGVVYYEESIDNVELAKEPERMISALKRASPMPKFITPDAFWARSKSLLRPLRGR